MPTTPAPAPISDAYAGANLTIDLDAIVANYRLLSGKLSGASLSAVVKADGYGLGAEPVAAALAGAGCRVFYIAHIEEGIRLRQALNDTGNSDFVQAEIHVLGGRSIGVSMILEHFRGKRTKVEKIRSSVECGVEWSNQKAPKFTTSK